MEEPKLYPIRLSEWIQEARSNSDLSNEVFLECAVDLSLMLTRRLCQIAETAVTNTSSVGRTFETTLDFASPRTSIQLRDVITENVIVYTDDLFDAQLEIKGVDIQPGQPLGFPDYGGIESFDQRVACHALGKILLEVFSRGKYSSSPYTEESALKELHQTSNSFDFDTMLKIEDEKQDLWLPPCKRTSYSSMKKKEAETPLLSLERNTVSHTTQSISIRAYNLLRDLAMPLSICRLVSDLLDAVDESELRPYSAMTTLDEAKSDLILMKEYPNSFLFDRTCPAKALDDANIFHSVDTYLYGRENEKNVLRGIAGRVSLHVRTHCEVTLEGSNGIVPNMQKQRFLCESIFLSGHAGSGKSSLILDLLHSRNMNDWFVVNCKFDRQVAPLMTVR